MTPGPLSMRCPAKHPIAYRGVLEPGFSGPSRVKDGHKHSAATRRSYSGSSWRFFASQNNPEFSMTTTSGFIAQWSLVTRRLST